MQVEPNNPNPNQLLQLSRKPKRRCIRLIHSSVCGISVHNSISKWTYRRMCTLTTRACIQWDAEGGGAIPAFALSPDSTTDLPSCWWDEGATATVQRGETSPNGRKKGPKGHRAEYDVTEMPSSSDGPPNKKSLTDPTAIFGGALDKGQNWEAPNMLKAVPMNKGCKEKGSMGGERNQGAIKNPSVPAQQGGWQPPEPKGDKSKGLGKKGKDLAQDCLKAPTVFIPI